FFKDPPTTQIYTLSLHDALPIYIQVRVDKARDIEFYFDANHASITPHAPYSCSKELFKTFRKLVSEDNILSIHNQESDEENKLRSEEHTSELQSRENLVCRLLLE